MSYITEIDILDEAKDCFLTYAEEVLTDRAIPSVEDGLLSSQRKILWTMEDYLNMSSKSKTKKCNAIVGSTLSTSYFHGDAACYGVLCKMGQEYLMRYPLIEGQGSLGSQESNDLVASSRYTEAKPSVYTDLMFTDFKKKIVPEKETYNGEFMEPIILPGLFPNALCNGRQAIGISMAHNSAPNNLTEVCNGIIRYIKTQGKVTVEDLMEDIKGPDFPLGGVVINQKDIKAAFEKGKSTVSLKIRGDYVIEGNNIIFTSIPYRTYRNKIKEQINNNIEELEKVIVDFNDESSVGINKLIFTVKNTSSINTALNKLFVLTDLQTTLSYNMNFIVNGTPKLCSLYDLIKYYVEHQETILLTTTKQDLDKAEKRLHILEGLVPALRQIDTVIEMIKTSNSKEEAKRKVIEFLKIDEIQAEAILNMKLSTLTHLDKKSLEQEKIDKEKLVEECKRIISNKEYRDFVLITKIENMRDKYGDARRTKLENISISKEEKEVEFVEPEKCVVIMTESGYIKRIPSSSFRTQKRNGKGVKTQDEITNSVIRTNTIDSLMVFTDQGQMYRLLVNDIPVGTNTTKGQSIRSLVSMGPNENPTIIYSIYKDTDAQFVLFTTKNGLVKKTPLEEYVKTKKKTGIAAIGLKEGDSLASVCLVKDEPIVLLTVNGMSIKFDTKEVSPTSRTASGVKGMNLAEGDYVVAALPIREATDKLAIFVENGMGKKITLSELPLQKRGGKGLYCYKPSTSTGKIAAGALVSDEDSLLVLGDKNSICISASDITEGSRASMGTQIIKNSNINSVSKV